MPRPYNLLLGEGTTKGERGLGADLYPTDQQLGAPPSGTAYDIPGSANTIINSWGGMSTQQSNLLLYAGIGLLALIVLPSLSRR
jgi:hypothetical protein